MKGWETKQIKELGRVITGKTPPTGNRDFFDGDELFVSPKDLDWNSYYVTQTETRISAKALEKFKNQVIPCNAVMFTCLSFAFGKMGIASKTCLTNQQINSIIVNSENNFKFVYYLLRAYEPIIFSYNSGIDTPIVPKSVFESIKVKVPDKPEQERIAAVLSAYDDLIENNKRRIALLEKMAEEIYREWFVRMRFPGHEKVKVVKGVPEGWQIKRLGEILKLCYGKALKEDERVPGDFPVFGSSGIVGMHKKALVNAPGIIVGRKGNVGSIHWSDKDFFPIDTVYYVSSDISVHYLYFMLESMNFINNDAAVPGLNRNQAYSNQFYLPPASLIQKFSDYARDLFALRDNLNSQNNKLIAVRDSLHPRLISGKLSVVNLDIQFPPSMQEETVR